jgi:hypothetical protein
MSSEDFKSLIVTDPDLVDEGIDVSGLRTTTDTSPFLLGNIPDYSGIQYSTLAPTKYTDLMRLYSQGLPTIDTSQPATPPSGGGGGGSGDGGQATNFDPVSTPIDNTFIGGGATLEDAGGTYDGYQSAEGGFEYTGTPTSDPFLASGAAGGERLPSTSPQEGFLASGAAGGANLPTEPQEGFLASGAAGGANLPTQTYANTGDPNLLDLAGGEAGGADGFGIIEDVVTEQDLADNTSLLQKLGLPADFDIKRAAIEAGINLVAGVPITLIAKGLEAILPDRDPRQNKLDEFYSTGEGAEYMSPTLPDGSPNPNYIPGMENYNTVSGNPLDPTFGLQEAYQDRIDTIENTLANKYGMTAAEIADVKAGSYTGDVDSDLLDRLVDLGDAKKKEQDILGITEGVKTGIQAADDDKGSDMLTTTPTGVNPFADIDTGVGEFDTTPVTGVTRPGTVLGKEGIDKFDDAETSIDMFDDLPQGASKTGTPIDSLNPINRQQHFDNTQKLKDAVAEGKISNETYNKLSAFDATKTMGLGPVTGTAATIGYQGIQTLAGDQGVGDMMGDIGRNIQGVSENLTPEEQVQYQEIISGEDIYRDPILGMVEPPAPMTLADDTINKMTDDVDLDDFDTTPQDAPTMTDQIGTFDADTFDDTVGSRGPRTIEFDSSDFTDKDNNDIFQRERELENEYMKTTGEVPTPGKFMGQAFDEKVQEKIREQQTVTPLEDDFDSDEIQTYEPPAPSTPVDEFSDEEFMVGDTSTAAPTGSDSGADNFFDAVDKSVTGTTKPGTKTEPTYQDAIMRGQTGGGNDGGNNNGGGKIVCTMMNESYGFGSFRNKIWMKFHKDLSPEYQKGYHKLFLPLVRIAKTNKVVKKVLEHIAVHSTIDMRQATRGRTHLLGRVYRKILLPLCYWVGKNAK